ncbi:hypothetical protein K431DRAFT_263120 [Polychaeton citri CBS 116435]|uniref:Zn(2)-C6 fungal-type domain-containing protein n=1 Tax=Polychaeton citri CBS 116435 TaxID=1314669 RepID=A0A9P4USR8_9PEZI|nr:hypothetical protein K431DRAFT_263120 [Polychaeton citri CBS 116435]
MSLPSEPSSDLSARHTCHCGNSFTRKEHLTRHRATHDRLAHICDVCQRQFSRRESLRRHSVLHDPGHTRVIVSCDACRSKKTKCSGGIQCSLCTRRGINCLRSGHPKSRPASIGDRPTNFHATPRQNEDQNEYVSRLLASPRLGSSMAGNSLRTEGRPSSHEWLLSVVPSKPVSPTESQPKATGMEAIYELLVAGKSSLEGFIRISDELHEWLTKCLEMYFKSFHLRWPILNSPSFDATTASLSLTAAVCVIGVWSQNDRRPHERCWALRVHEILLQHLLHKLIDPELVPEGQAWPIELFQTVLLTMIFSLHRINEGALSRVMLLRGAFISLLRQIGAFDPEMLANHLHTHFSGTYAPYTFSMREKFKRMLASTYQFDVYFALAHEKPALLHHQEVGVDLTTTFALWNAHGLDIFAKRLLEEPTERSGFRISEMTNCPGSFTSSRLLVEDVLLGLCGVLQAIWVHNKSLLPETKEYHSNALQRALIIETLDAWKHELCKISTLADPKNITSDDARYLLLAYRGEDDSVGTIMERITTLVQDGMILYYYLKMYHYAGQSLSRLSGLGKQVEGRCLETLRMTKYEREALISALQMLKMVDSVGALDASSSPLIRFALAMGANLTKRVLASSEKCECPTKEGQHSTEMDLQRWIEIGGPLYIDCQPVCVCKLQFWIGTFEEASQGVGIL